MVAKFLFKKAVWFVAGATAFLVLVWADWFPVLKDLNRLKREEREYTAKTDRLRSALSRFAFPNNSEKLVLAAAADRLLASLPSAADDASWLAMVISHLRDRARLDDLDDALVFSQDRPGQSAAAPVALLGRYAGKDLRSWLDVHEQEIDRGLQASPMTGHFPWHDFFGGKEFVGRGQLACRPIAVAVAGKLPELLHFINHCSWSAGRLEIFRLDVGQGEGRSLALVFCRGLYRVSTRSPWLVPDQADGTANGMLIDADSDILWQPVDPRLRDMVKKNELPLF